MPVSVVEARAGVLEAAVEAVHSQALLVRYGLDGAKLLALLRRGQAAQDMVLVAIHASADGQDAPCGLLWGMARGAFASAGYLRLLLIAEHTAKKGAGRALVRAFEARCDAPKGGFFALTEAQGGAEGFYHKLGYGPVGVLPGFVRPERTEVLLWKSP